MSFVRLIVILLAIASSVQSARGENEKLLIFAASSLRDVLLDIRGPFEKLCDCKAIFSFASTSILARQVDAGAPADVFISASSNWIDWLTDRNKNLEQPKIIARNELVIASTAPTRDGFNILLRQRFSMGDPSGVPAGVYAKEALEKLGIWEVAKKNAVFTENVRVALSMVARGDLQSGIVYASDLQAEPELHAHYRFPATSHSPIIYQAIALKADKNTENFLQFLTGKNAQAEFLHAGFLGAGDG